MLKQQIRAWEVLDEKVLEAMESIPRELFVPEGFTDFAFADMEIPLSNDEYMTVSYTHLTLPTSDLV